MSNYTAMQNVSRITAEMSRSPATINSINSMCYHYSDAWRLLLTNTDFFSSIPVFFLSIPGSTFVTRDAVHQIDLWHNSWEVTGATPQIHLSPSCCSLDVSKWDDWHDRWKIRRTSGLAFILDWAAGCGSNCVYGWFAWGEFCCPITSVLVAGQGRSIGLCTVMAFMLILVFKTQIEKVSAVWWSCKATNRERRKLTDQLDQAVLTRQCWTQTADLQDPNEESQFQQETWAAGCAQKLCQITLAA